VPLSTSNADPIDFFSNRLVKLHTTRKIFFNLLRYPIGLLREKEVLVKNLRTEQMESCQQSTDSLKKSHGKLIVSNRKRTEVSKNSKIKDTTPLQRSPKLARKRLLRRTMRKRPPIRRPTLIILPRGTKVPPRNEIWSLTFEKKKNGGASKATRGEESGPSWLWKHFS
jgi:hypothetical protein